MAFTQEQLDTLEAAIASGTLTVKYGDKQITYQSLEHMMNLRSIMRKELGLTSQAPRVTYGQYEGLA